MIEAIGAVPEAEEKKNRCQFGRYRNDNRKLFIRGEYTRILGRILARRCRAIYCKKNKTLSVRWTNHSVTSGYQPRYVKKKKSIVINETNKQKKIKKLNVIIEISKVKF